MYTCVCGCTRRATDLGDHVVLEFAQREFVVHPHAEALLRRRGRLERRRGRAERVAHVPAEVGLEERETREVMDALGYDLDPETWG